MRTKIICSLFILFFLSGCKKEPQYERYENHTISACGINDPLKNIEWLNIYCKNNLKAYFIEIYIYENTDTKENYFVIYTLNEDSENYQINVFSCSNELLFHWNTGTSPSPQYTTFFSNKKEICKIWSVKEIIEQSL